MSAPNCFVMPFLDTTGTAYPAAVFVSIDVHLDLIDAPGPQEAITFECWGNMTDFLSHKAPLQAEQHVVHVDTATYLGYLSTPAIGTTVGDVDSLELAALAQAIKDTPVTNPDGTPKLDANGVPILGSFFAGATITPIG